MRCLGAPVGEGGGWGTWGGEIKDGAKGRHWSMYSAGWNGDFDDDDDVDDDVGDVG